VVVSIQQVKTVLGAYLETFDATSSHPPIRTDEDEARFLLAPACSTGRSPAPEPAPARGSEAAGKVVCCALDGSSSNRSYDGLCLSTGTSSPATYLDAVGICSGAGMRLCDTREELDRSCGPECGLDGALVWTTMRYQNVGGGPFSLSLSSTGAADWRPLIVVLAFVVLVLAFVGRSWCVWRCCPCRKSSKHQYSEQDAFIGDREQIF